MSLKPLQKSETTPLIDSFIKSELEKYNLYNENFGKINQLFPLILPAIKSHNHLGLKNIFDTGINPKLAITEFGTMPRYEAAKCYECRNIIRQAEIDYEEAEKDFENRRAAKKMMELDLPLSNGKKRKSASDSSISSKRPKKEVTSGSTCDKDPNSFDQMNKNINKLFEDILTPTIKKP